MTTNRVNARRAWLVVLAALPVLAACNAKGELGAYLHKTTASAEPPSTVALATSGAPSANQPIAVTPTNSALTAPAPLASGAPTAPVKSTVTSVASPTGKGVQHPLALDKPGALAADGGRVWAPPVVAGTPLAAPTPAAVQAVVAPKKDGKRNASVGGSSVSGGTVGNAARVVAGLRAGLRDCYSRETSNTVGSIRFTLSVGANGAVSNVSAAPSGELSSGLLACATAHLRGAKFDPPEGGAASIRIPVTFTIQ